MFFLAKVLLKHGSLDLFLQGPLSVFLFSQWGWPQNLLFWSYVFLSRFAGLGIPISGIIETSMKDLFQSLLIRLLTGKIKYSVTLWLGNHFFHHDMQSDYLD